VDLEDREEGSLATRDQVMTNQRARATFTGHYADVNLYQRPETGSECFDTWGRPEGED
jgi:hypothetical protein